MEDEAENEYEENLEFMVDGIVEEIVNELGLNYMNFYAIPATNVRNFQAEFDRQSKTFDMYYSFTFLKNLDAQIGNKWELIFVIYVITAHEIGHQLNGDVHGSGGHPDLELGADYFAGRTAAKHQIPYASAVRVYQLCTSVGATTTHPGREDRIAAFSEGYNDWK